MKTFLHRLFGLGRIPRKYREALLAEGVVLLDEGIGGSVGFKKFRAPGKYYSNKRSWFTGSLVLTEKTIAAFSFFQPLIFVPLDHERLGALRCSADERDKLEIRYDAALFNEQWSGTVTCRYRTTHADAFLKHLLERGTSAES